MKRFHWNSKTLLLAVVLVIGCGLGGTLAWLSATTGEVVNTFTPAQVMTEIEEELDQGVKENVKVQNTGDVEAYIRAKIVVNWADENGNLSGKPVQASDYEISYGTSWTELGGYYYYNGVVAPKDSTQVLITSCKPKEGTAPEGYALQVTILAEGIQFIPDQAVREAWGMQFSNGQWSASNT